MTTPTCPKCHKELISMDFHELATMYACPHGHHYAVIGPDDEYAELTYKDRVVNCLRNWNNTRGDEGSVVQFATSVSELLSLLSDLEGTK